MRKITLIISAILISLGSYAQVAPTAGKKQLRVRTKYINEYSQTVTQSFATSPYNYHMNKLPKKLAKYGFTNVKITALGSVIGSKRPSPISRIGVAIAKWRVGATPETVIHTATTKIDKSLFQVNFTSDQGSFKVRLNVFVSPKYIIKNTED